MENRITPKELAQRIWNDFDMIIYTDQDHNAQVKKCCLYHCDQMLSVLDPIEESETTYGWRDFYEKVKQELEKM